MSRPLHPRERKILAAVAGLLALFAADRFLLRGGFRAGEGLESLVLREEASLARERRLLEDREEIVRRHKRLSEDSSSGRAPQASTTELLSEVEGLARRHGLNLLDMKPQPGTKNEPPSLSIQAEGGWEALSSFLLAVEGPSSFLRAERGTVRLKGDPSSRIEARLTIRSLR